MFLLNVTLWLMIFHEGRSPTRIQAIVLSMSNKTMCKVPLSVKCYATSSISLRAMTGIVCHSVPMKADEVVLWQAF